MVTIREEKIADVAAREALLDEAYGAARFTKTSERLREGREPAKGLALVAVERGRIVGTIRPLAQSLNRLAADIGIVVRQGGDEMGEGSGSFTPQPAQSLNGLATDIRIIVP